MLKSKFSVRQLFFPLIIVISMLSLVCAPDTKNAYKKTVHTFNEAWNTGNYDLLDESVHPEYFKQEGEMEINGIEPLKEYIKNWRDNMPDAKIIYIDEVFDAEKAAVLFTLEGTPVDSGKKFKAEGIVIFKFKAGKIVADNSVFDQLSSLQQQGYQLVPPSEK